MKNLITGKQINEWAQKVNDLPNYWGDKFDWSDKLNKYTKVAKGEFVAKRYKAIVELIAETKAAVNITPDAILIEYKTGQAKICRDILTDNFLMPLINCNVGFNSVTI